MKQFILALLLIFALFSIEATVYLPLPHPVYISFDEIDSFTTLYNIIQIEKSVFSTIRKDSSPKGILTKSRLHVFQVGKT